MSKPARAVLSVSVVLVAALGGLAAPASAAEPAPVPLGVDECAVDVNDQGVVVTDTHLVDRGRVLPLPGGLTSAAAVNDRGQVAGLVDGRAAFWDGRRLHLIGVADPADTFETVSAVSNRGEVVGTSGTFGGERHAWRWRQGVLTPLAGLDGSTGANDVNDHGQVVGDAWSGDTQHAVLWQPDGTLVPLATLGDGTGSSLASAIDVHGRAAGYSYTSASTGDMRAVRWATPTSVRDVSPAGHAFGIVADLNDRGVAVGSILPPGAPQHGFVQDSAGRVRLVAPPDGAAALVLSAVNEVGLAAGCVIDDDGVHAITWRG
ncbi:HAF family extracellular repeat-containing protein [Cellulomonas fimi]|uniref:Extracellular repeat protein, HAF family n=1 Tax=Cellulomonas fimi (strain ATCC 484 / DSM 20113 / JCM 1341 / CCUG 24087 / LMG 16345 / NBRC 15513 / NCIMB 8980 / NCTC 7547 / NRS-133) TaxID=590998 RepID=F4GYF5_CELFA|nr:HAF family extracellular repeat-containing protein [Cellulomonas fimi]AEE45944.1 extracellular repeat protein, HAF family [Cellulomonas fimi ATCC 484]NNH06530.1 hypothetical protein [Cellulomonas fimi]VEH31075.1 probable extracellular repeat, HAF family [Cellulomonas fimi]